MPFVSFERPSLGLSLLQAQLRRRKHHCDVRHLTFDLADSLGADTYQWVSNELPYTAFVGDWVFARALYGSDAAADRAYVRKVLVSEWQRSRAEVEKIFRVRSECELFLGRCLNLVDWAAYEVVGFTSTFTQNLASLALAQRLKKSFPDLLIVFGGANWEGDMGLELLRAFPFVDLACQGEADESFPSLIDVLERTDPENTLASRLGESTPVAGVAHRNGSQIVAADPAKPIRNLDDLPIGDFEDFFRDWSESSVNETHAPQLLLETSRGCWWGDKSHCTFCGLNGASMQYRSKSEERALAEIRFLKERYGAVYIEVVDNIMDMRYFKTLLPRLVEEKLDVRLFYEVKSNLRLDHVRMLSNAGVHCIQPGIESFSDHVLKLMGKGVTGLQNIQLLKWCKEFGIRPEWNLLYGFPGESPSDYAEMMPVLKSICFLDAPCGYGPVRLDRFSPYQTNPSAYGMSNIRPMEAYQFLYPQSTDDERFRISYYFEFDYSVEQAPLDYVDPLIDYIRKWQKGEYGGSLWALTVSERELIILDNRMHWPNRKLRLTGWRAALYNACDRIQSRRSIDELIGDEASAEEIDRFLSLLVKLSLMLRSENRYLSLAVHRPKREAQRTERRASSIPFERSSVDGLHLTNAQASPTIPVVSALTRNM